MNTTRASGRFGLFLAAWVIAAGCADPAVEPPARVCTPGATQRCECAVGTSVQSCALDGTHWERCECTTADAAVSDDLGSDDARAPDDARTSDDVADDATRADTAADVRGPEDAVFQDASSADAAPVDGAADVALVDAGSADSVAGDRGTVDATVTDAGAPPTDARADAASMDVATDARADATATDARVDTGTDAGAIDVRPSDATTGDAGGACTPAAVGTVSTTVTTTGSFYAAPWPVVAQAGGEVLVLGPFDRWRRWYRWSGSDWASESIPWPADVTDPTVAQVTSLVDRTMLVIFTQGTRRELAVYDGRAWTARLPLPDTFNLVAATRTPDGVFRLLTNELGGLAMRDATPGSIGAPAPVPMPSVSPQNLAMAALTNGRVVIAYVQRSLYVVHRVAGANWVGPVDLTSSWAVERTGPTIAAARGGGVLVGLTGVSTSYRFPHVFASPDGARWNEGETLNRLLTDGLGSLDAECIENPIAILHGGYRVGPRVWRRVGGTWSQIDGPPPWPNGSSSAVVRPSGRVFWTWDQNNEAVTSFSVTMRGGRE